MLELTKRRLDVSELQLGMFVCELDRPWEETSFLFQGFPLMTPEDLAVVRHLCHYVYVDETRRVKLERTTKPKAPKAEPRHAPPRKKLSEEVDGAKNVHAMGSYLIKDVFLDLQLGRGIDTGACRQVIRRCVESLTHNENALLWLTRIKTVDGYTAEHCLSVAILAMGFARFLGHAEAELENIGLCGLLHDVGKVKIDPLVLNKPGRLDKGEFDHMKQHAQFGFDLLTSQRGLPPAAVDVAYNHHERIDGSGYPRGLSAEQIPYLARLVGLCDCYDAITSNRCYDSARPPKDAYKVMMDGRNSQFDARLVLRFIQWLGVFPVGTLVELHTGEVGVVLEIHPQFRLRPRVVVLRDADKQPCKPRYLDLARISVDGDGNPYRIKDSLADGAHGLYLCAPEIKTVLDAEALRTLEDGTAA